MTPLVSSWQTFFSAEIGASAALTGLVMVAASVNLPRIMSHELLPGRAAETVIALGGALALSSLLLLPGQPAIAQGIECGLIGATSLAAPFTFQLHAHRSAFSHSQSRPLVRAVLSSLVGVPLLVAGGLLFWGDFDGLYWAAAGLILSLVVGIIGAWVLLVEINR
jgi:putative flippase GtrA